MAIENGEWIMRGLDWYDPARIQSWDELIEWIDEIGFLPLFKNEVDGFSVEENTADLYWWSGDEAQDPWEWRCLMARSGKVAYGKFFGKRAGFISKAWFPHFANWRRDGYDFDSRWEDERATMRQKRIMDRFLEQEEWFSSDLKRQAGFGKGGERNFEGTVTADIGPFLHAPSPPDFSISRMQSRYWVHPSTASSVSGAASGKFFCTCP